MDKLFAAWCTTYGWSSRFMDVLRTRKSEPTTKALVMCHVRKRNESSCSFLSWHDKYLEDIIIYRLYRIKEQIMFSHQTVSCDPSKIRHVRPKQTTISEQTSLLRWRKLWMSRILPQTWYVEKGTMVERSFSGNADRSLSEWALSTWWSKANIHLIVACKTLEWRLSSRELVLEVKTKEAVPRNIRCAEANWDDNSSCRSEMALSCFPWYTAKCRSSCGSAKHGSMPLCSSTRLPRT